MGSNSCSWHQPSHFFQAEEYDFSVDCLHEEEIILNTLSKIPSLSQDLRTLSKWPVSNCFWLPEGVPGLIGSLESVESVEEVWEGRLGSPKGLDTMTDPAKLVQLSLLVELFPDVSSSSISPEDWMGEMHTLSDVSTLALQHLSLLLPDLVCSWNIFTACGCVWLQRDPHPTDSTSCGVC